MTMDAEGEAAAQETTVCQSHVQLSYEPTSYSHVSPARKRRRSPSPYDRDRDRFDPRPRYADDYGTFRWGSHCVSRSHGYRAPSDAHSRGYGYGSSPPRRSYSASTRRAPPDPHTFDYPSSLKQYAEWFRYYYPQQAAEEDNADKAAEQDAGDGSRPRNGIRTRWEKYKKEFSANQVCLTFSLGAHPFVIGVSI